MARIGNVNLNSTVTLLHRAGRTIVGAGSVLDIGAQTNTATGKVTHIAAPAYYPPGPTLSSNNEKTLGELSAVNNHRPFTTTWPLVQLRKELIRDRPILLHDSMEASGAHSEAAAGNSGDVATDTDGTIAAWTLVRVKLDAIHSMFRIVRAIPNGHPHYGAFCAEFRDAMFGIDADDVRSLKADLQRKGMTTEEVDRYYVTNYDYFVRRCRRCIPEPDHLVASLQSVFDRYANRMGKTSKSKPESPLFSPSAHKEARNVLRHAKIGCLSDIPGVSLYYYKNVGGQQKLFCARGTNALEGYHNHLRRAFGCFQMSPKMIINIMEELNTRWNARVEASRGMTHPGVSDYKDTRESFYVILSNITHDAQYGTSNVEDECSDAMDSDLDEPDVMLDVGVTDDDVECDTWEPASPPKTAAKEMANLYKLPEGTTMINPKAPNKDEVELYKKLALEAGNSISGREARRNGVNLQKLEILWGPYHKSNPKKYRCVTVALLRSLSEVVKKRTSIKLARRAYKEDDRIHSKASRHAERPGMAFQQHVKNITNTKEAVSAMPNTVTSMGAPVAVAATDMIGIPPQEYDPAPRPAVPSTVGCKRAPQMCGQCGHVRHLGDSKRFHRRSGQGAWICEVPKVHHIPLKNRSSIRGKHACAVCESWRTDRKGGNHSFKRKRAVDD